MIKLYYPNKKLTIIIALSSIISTYAIYYHFAVVDILEKQLDFIEKTTFPEVLDLIQDQSGIYEIVKSQLESKIAELNDSNRQLENEILQANRELLFANIKNNKNLMKTAQKDIEWHSTRLDIYKKIDGKPITKKLLREMYYLERGSWLFSSKGEQNGCSAFYIDKTIPPTFSKPICIASHDYELAGRLPLQRAREILTELKRQMADEGKSHG